MKIGINAGGFWKDLATLRALARSAAEDGFRNLWLSQSTALDTLTAFTAIGIDCPTLELGASIIPIHGRHPLALAAQALTVQAAIGPRVILGIGTSHRPFVETMLGLPYDRPYAHLEEYVKVLRPLLRGEKTDFDGHQLGVHATLTIDAPPPQVILAALGPRTIELAGREADGVVTWMVGPKTFRDFLLPRLLASAERAGRPRPRVVVGVPVCVTDDLERARKAARAKLDFYDALPAYKAVLDREGYAHPVDMLIAGSEASVREQLLELEHIGATDLRVTEMCSAPDDQARTRALLKSLLPS